ncbi:MAG: putative short-subunit dehydrogenase-like oxidoreductase (DUF2520 family) [Planctomycetota bacterium]|jgi:predicted short-subunit dehydrogenase-like oxidoreductase (DUF2520 family)
MAQGLRCDGVWTPSPTRPGRPDPEALGLQLHPFDGWGAAKSQLLLLAPSDDQMADLVTKIANSLPTNQINFDCCACHISGSLDLKILEPLKRIGFGASAIHPLRAFSQHETEGNSLSDVFCGMQQGSDHSEQLTNLFRAAGAKIVAISENGKTKYHLAAAMASNLIVALLDRSESILKEACPGIVDPKGIISSLASNSLNEYSLKGAAEALTGPIERGDVHTVVRHLDALQALPREKLIYQALSHAILDMALTKDGQGAQSAEKIRSLLNDGK